MIKLLWRFGLLVAAAILFAWLADRPGQIAITWLGREIHMSVLVGITLLALGLAGLYFVWRLTHRIWSSPRMVREHWRFRKHRKAYESLSRGIIAAGAGDAQAATRHAAIAGETLKNEPLVTLLTAQAAQLKGDKAGVKRAFEAMTQSADTELLGLRGLFAEAKQAGDWAAARNIADRALAKNPRLPWASTAVLQVQTTSKDWAAAAATVASQAKVGLLPREEAAKKQAALLAAQALAEEEKNSQRALALALEAHQLDVGLVPAALVGARCFIASGNPKKALRMLRSTWAQAPHPDLALLVANLKTSDGADERFERVRDFVGKPESNIEAAWAMARSAINAKRFDAAKSALQNFSDDHPQARICGLMAEIEDALGDKGRSREWLARALHAPRDPMWVSDGVASAYWTAVSPVTGEIVSCEWKQPFEMISNGSWQVQDTAEAPAIAGPATENTATIAAPIADDPGIE